VYVRTCTRSGSESCDCAPSLPFAEAHVRKVTSSQPSPSTLEEDGKETSRMGLPFYPTGLEQVWGWCRCPCRYASVHGSGDGWLCVCVCVCVCIHAPTRDAGHCKGSCTCPLSHCVPKRARMGFDMHESRHACMHRPRRATTSCWKRKRKETLKTRTCARLSNGSVT
jgi:hypothetical protein